jgi:hypothetical protein
LNIIYSEKEGATEEPPFCDKCYRELHYFKCAYCKETILNEEAREAFGRFYHFEHFFCEGNVICYHLIALNYQIGCDSLLAKGIYYPKDERIFCGDCIMLDEKDLPNTKKKKNNENDNTNKPKENNNDSIVVKKGGGMVITVKQSSHNEEDDSNTPESDENAQIENGNSEIEEKSENVARDPKENEGDKEGNNVSTTETTSTSEVVAIDAEEH